MNKKNDTRLGGFDPASTKLLEDLVLALDLVPTEEEWIQSIRDSWFNTLAFQHA